MLLIYLISLLKQELYAFNQLLGEQSEQHMEIWVPLPALYSLTLDNFMVYTVPRAHSSCSSISSFQTFVKGYSHTAYLRFQGQIVMAPSPSKADSNPSFLADEKGIACQNLTFYRQKKDGKIVELNNWGDGGRALIYSGPDETRARGSKQGFLGPSCGDLDSPFPMLTVTPKQHYWLTLLLTPQGISCYLRAEGCANYTPRKAGKGVDARAEEKRNEKKIDGACSPHLLSWLYL